MTSQIYFKTIKIVHLALVAGIIFFMLIALFLQFNGFGKMGKEFNTIFIYVASLFVLVGISASYLISKRKLKACLSKPTLLEKLNSYREVLVLKFALLEAPAFFVIVVYLLTGNLFYIGLAILTLIFFVIHRPTVTSTITDLALNSKEQQIINNPDSVIE